MGILNRITSFIKAPFKKKRIIREYGTNFTFHNTDLATNETIFSAVSLLSNTLGSLPLKLYKNYNPVGPGEHNLARLIEYYPNQHMTPMDLIKQLETIRNTYGNAYALVMDNGYMKEVLLLDPDKVEPIVERDTKELYYEIKEDGRSTFIHHTHIIHVKHIHTIGHKGINPLDVLRDTITYDREVKEFSLNQMKNGLHADIVIEIGSNIDLSDENTRTNLDNMIRRFKNNGILFLDSGKTVKELRNKSFIDPKVFDVESITIARVARVYNIPLHKLLSEKQSYSSAEQADLEYIKDTMLPIVRMYEQEFNRKLLTETQRDEGYSFKFNLNGLARADMNTRGNFYFKGIRSAWFTPNEVRALEEMPPKEGGDELFCSRDLIPLSKLDTLLENSKTNTKT